VHGRDAYPGSERHNGHAGFSVQAQLP
jgi:hypothetical protein